MYNEGMKIVVFGANGRVGSLAVAELLKRGYKVKAFVHSGSNFKDNKNLEVTKGDIYSKDDVAKAIKGADVVISALGSWGTPKKDILTSGMKNIIPAMQQNKIKRIVSLTGSDAKAPGDAENLLHRASHLALSVIASKILRDGENHIELLNQSGLDWSVVRSPVMNDRGNASKSELNLKRPKPWATINRKSVALAMVDLIEPTKHLRQAPYISRKN
jgi:putative NADH-flavin reductase